MTEPIWRRILRLHGPNPRADVEEEFAFHLEERTEALMARGMSEKASREMALQQFGDLPGATATCADIGLRRARRVRWRERLESVWQDVAYSAMAMRRSPGFTLAVVSTIALGIGANTAVFSLLNALLFQPLDADRPDELVRIYTSEGGASRNERDRLGGSSYADYLDLRQSPALAGLAASTPLAASVQLDGTPRRFEARVVSENYFQVLGRAPFLGGWPSGDGVTGSPDVIVSYRFWMTNLGADPSILGRPLTVNSNRVRVAGVTSPSFRGVEPTNVDLYVPFGSAAGIIGRPEFLTGRSERSVRLLGRLARDATPQTAAASLDAIMQALGAEFPASNANRAISVRPASSIVPLELAGPAMLPTAGLVFGATLVMLAISGVNVAAVLLARTIRRRRELAVRLSLGASPFRLVRQLVTESLVLALLAGLLVILLVSLLPLLASRLGVPPAIQPTIDSAVLGYAVAVAVGFGLLFGLAPALVGIRSDVVESLRSGEAGGRPTKARGQRLLVSAQLALSMLLLVVGGALLASLKRQQEVDPGFAIEGLIVANFEDPSGISDRGRNRSFTRLAVERLGALPGVASLSVTNMPPLTSEGARSTIQVPGYTALRDEDMDVAMATAGPDFFRTLGIPMQSGRELTWEDRDTLPRVVINRSMADRYWASRDPVGTFVRLGGEGGRPAEVIGVAGDARFISLAEAPGPMFVVQRVTEGGEGVLIRTRGDAGTVMLGARGAMSRSDIPLTLVQLRTMEDVLHTSLAMTRAVSDTLLVIGLLAVLLAAVGLYGVVSYVMAGRTREFGIRRALGATPSLITRLVLGYGMRLTMIGGVVGVLLGLGALRLINGMLFGPWSVLPIVVVAGLALSGVTLIACMIPAVRATAVSPASALRSE